MDWTLCKPHICATKDNERKTFACILLKYINQNEICGKTYTACCCQNLSGNSWRWGDLLLLESMNTHHSCWQGVISICEYVHNVKRHSQPALLGISACPNKSNSTTVYINWLPISIQSQLTYITNISASDSCKSVQHIPFCLLSPRHTSPGWSTCPDKRVSSYHGCI